MKRRDEGYLRRRVMKMEVQGRCRKGRPKLNWKDRLREDLEERQVEEE